MRTRSAASISPRLVSRLTLDRWRQVTDVPLVVVALGSLPLLLLEVDRHSLPHHDRVFLDIVNLAVLIAFAVDFGAELLLAEDRRRHLRTQWGSLVIVLAQGAAIVPGLAGLGALRALRGARLLRLVAASVRLLAVGGLTAGRGGSVLRRHAAGLALGTAGLTWITSAVVFTLAEDVGPKGGSFFDALWWSTCTITTVGYGDIYPVTAVGRLTGAFTMVVGVSAFAVITARIAQILVRPETP